MGVFREIEQRRFRLSPLGLYLRTGAMRAFAMMLGEEPYRAWDDLLDSVRTGEPAFEKRYGMRFDAEGIRSLYHHHDYPLQRAEHSPAVGDLTPKPVRR